MFNDANDLARILRLHVFLLIEADWRIYASVNFPPLIQIIACRLVGAKPLSKLMLEYC